MFLVTFNERKLNLSPDVFEFHATLANCTKSLGLCARSRENVLTAAAREQRDIFDVINKDPTIATAVAEGEARRTREEAVKAIKEVEV